MYTRGYYVFIIEKPYFHIKNRELSEHLKKKKKIKY